MGKRAQIGRGRKVVSVSVATSGRGLSKPSRGQEWRKDLLTSWLFQTCIKLQTSLDRRFLRFGMTVQEASVLLRCVEARRITPGQLAIALGRDKGKITRFVDRLESSRLLTRDVDPCDRRFSILKPTAKGKQVARALASAFDSIRKELFVGILESDVLRLSKMLPELHKNAVQLGSRHKCDVVRGRKRIGSQGMKTEGPQTSPPQIAAEIVTPSPKGHAANRTPIEEQSAESEEIRCERNSEESATPGMFVDEQEALVLK
jgi:DNA-binding MarR family transcriptional regulator